MVKAFKIVMNIILILFIAAICAVFVPPLLGVTTAIATPGIETNMQTGSVAYGMKTSLSDLNSGDRIIVTDQNSTNIYDISEIDSSTGELTVSDGSGDSDVIELRRSASRVFVVIPYLGYLYIATQSFEGLVILGLAAALIIILFIISGIVSRKNEEDEDEEDEDGKDSDDFGYFRDLAASTSTPNRLDALSGEGEGERQTGSTKEIPVETVALDEELEDVNGEPASNDEAVPGETGELILEPADDGEAAGNSGPADVSDAAAEKNDNTEAATSYSDAKDADNGEAEKNNVQSSTDNSEGESDLSKIGSALEEALGTERMNQPEEAKSGAADSQGDSEAAAAPDSSAGADTDEAEDNKGAEIELAIPVHTLDELLQEAYTKGEDPQVRKDPNTGLTLVDYSSCF